MLLSKVMVMSYQSSAVVDLRTHTLLTEELFDESDSFNSLCKDFVKCQQIIEILKYTLTMLEEGFL